MPFLNDTHRQWLQDLLDGVSDRIRNLSFRSKWSSVIGIRQRTVTGEIIRARLQWEKQEALKLPPSPP
jgi:hypothetical protein